MSFKTHAKRKAAVLLAVDAAHIQHLGVNHACAEHFNPARAFADAATLSVAVDTGQVNLSRRLGEREEARAEARAYTSSP